MEEEHATESTRRVTGFILEAVVLEMIWKKNRPQKAYVELHTVVQGFTQQAVVLKMMWNEEQAAKIVSKVKASSAYFFSKT